MDKTTIAIGIVLVVIVGGIVYVASQSPSAQAAVGFGPETRGASSDAQDAGAVLSGIGDLIGGVGTAIGSIYGGAAASAAGGTSQSGVAK